MKTFLHRLAIRRGWYSVITYGMPLNICRTVFGTYFLEGVYMPVPIGKLVEELHEWGFRDGFLAATPKPHEDYVTEWRVTKDGKRRYRRVATKILANSWRTESEELPQQEVAV